MRFEETDVVIVGGRVAGFAMAVEAFRRGLAARVLRRDIEGVEAPLLGCLLQPAALASLANLEIYDAIRSAGVVLERLALYPAGATEPAAILDYGDVGMPFPHAIGIRHDAFQAVCLDTFARYTAIRVEQGVELLSLLRENGRVNGAVARNREGDVSYRAKAIVVTTASGGAPVRAEAGADLITRPYPEKCGSLLIPRPEGFPGEVRLWLGGGMLVAAHPVSARDLKVLVIAADATLQAAGAATAGGEALRRLIVPAAPLLEDALKGADTSASLHFEPCVRATLKSWVSDAVVLIGPAALAMTPAVLALESQAILDARAFAAVLSRCQFSGDFSRHALRPFETARRPAVEALQLFSHDLHRAALASGGLFAGAGASGLARLGASPALRKSVIRRLGQFHDAPLRLSDRLRLGGFLPLSSPPTPAA